MLMRGRRWLYLAALVVGIPVGYVVLLNLGL